MNSGNINYLFDTYAWVEYFLGTEKGEKVKFLLEENEISTSIISIAELSDKYYRERLFEEWKERYNFIINKSAILPISLKCVENVGQRKWELRKTKKGIGLVDSLIIETAKENSLLVVTGDPHFSNLENVYFLR
ncbi:MAG: type II toxin-antitoxin system VapC family toxin [Promethearchaeota archaeon]